MFLPSHVCEEVWKCHLLPPQDFLHASVCVHAHMWNGYGFPLFLQLSVSIPAGALASILRYGWGSQMLSKCHCRRWCGSNCTQVGHPLHFKAYPCWFCLCAKPPHSSSIDKLWIITMACTNMITRFHSSCFQKVPLWVQSTLWMCSAVCLLCPLSSTSPKYLTYLDSCIILPKELVPYGPLCISSE